MLCGSMRRTSTRRIVASMVEMAAMVGTRMLLTGPPLTGADRY